MNVDILGGNARDCRLHDEVIRAFDHVDAEGAGVEFVAPREAASEALFEETVHSATKVRELRGGVPTDESVAHGGFPPEKVGGVVHVAEYRTGLAGSQ